MKKFLLIAGICIIIVFAGMQFIRPTIENAPTMDDLEAPPEVKAILVKACYDCHSNQSNLRWYDLVQPVYWQVADDVKKGREVLNFSNWDKLPEPAQKAKLWEAINQVQLGAMPLKSYAFIHGDVSHTELATLKNYLLGMVHSMPNDTAKINARDKQLKALHATAGAANPKALNGVEYIPDFSKWQILSTSDRFDNGTMRVIYGNDIAIKAVKENNINPYPNGAIFAKAAWDKIEDKDGNVSTGAYQQVEFMIKNAEKYKATKGWGFARFKTTANIPYGKTAMFTSECINCHKPVENSDFIFTLPIKN